MGSVETETSLDSEHELIDNTECDKMTSWSVISLVSLLTLLDLLDLSLGGCMFQEPFYFTSAPKINAILDRRGRPIADK